LREKKRELYLFVRPTPQSKYWGMQMLDHLLERIQETGVIYTTDRAQFGLGLGGTGAPVHFHRPAFNFNLRGTKRWFLFPQESAAWSNTPMSELLAADVGFPPPWASVCKQAMQEAGDIFFVPSHVGHGVLNEGPGATAAVAQEILQLGVLAPAAASKGNGESKSHELANSVGLLNF
jgi:hypothetical protein